MGLSQAEVRGLEVSLAHTILPSGAQFPWFMCKCIRYISHGVKCCQIYAEGCMDKNPLFRPLILLYMIYRSDVVKYRVLSDLQDPHYK